MTKALAFAIEKFAGKLGFGLTAPCVAQSSSAARVKLLCRAAASKALRAFNDGKRGRIPD
jgi:hypothetical protein